MSKRLTPIKIAYYIANSTSIEEQVIFRDYLRRHPQMNFYVGKLLNKNDSLSGDLLKEGNEQLVEDFFNTLKLEPCSIHIKKRNYSPKQFSLFD